VYYICKKKLLVSIHHFYQLKILTNKGINMRLSNWIAILEISNWHENAPKIIYSIVEVGCEGESNINADPLVR